MVINTRSCPSRLKVLLICYRIWITMWSIRLLILKSMRWCHHLLPLKWESLDFLTKWGCKISKDYQNCQRSQMARLKTRTVVVMQSKTTPKSQMWFIKETKVTTNPTQMLTLLRPLNNPPSKVPTLIKKALSTSKFKIIRSHRLDSLVESKEIWLKSRR